MANKFKDISIKYFVTNGTEYPIYNFKVYIEPQEFRKISGHRFVSLVMMDDTYRNDLQTLLGFIGRSPYIENDYMKCGRILENPIITTAEKLYGIKVTKQNFGFEDLENGTDDYHFMRDLMFEDNGEEYVGEVKTFYNKQKLNWKGNDYPEPHLSWWLQTRLECEILNKKGRIFYYYVPKTSMEKVIGGKIDIKIKNLFQSDDIVPTDEPEPVIEEHLGHLGCQTFRDVMAFAEYRKFEMEDDYYEDDDGGYYLVSVPINDAWWGKQNHVEKYIEEIKNYITIEEIE